MNPKKVVHGLGIAILAFLSAVIVLVAFRVGRFVSLALAPIVITISIGSGVYVSFQKIKIWPTLDLREKLKVLLYISFLVITCVVLLLVVYGLLSLWLDPLPKVNN